MTTSNRNHFPRRRIWPSSPRHGPHLALSKHGTPSRAWQPFDDLRPVKKFTDRKAAVARIFKAVQRLFPDVQPQSTSVATERTRSKKSPPQAMPRARPQTGATELRTKKAEVIALMKRAKGASLPEIIEATGWQKHTVRGFVSALGSKGGEKIESSKNTDSACAYRITK